jgi:hypothetical protein
MVLMEPKSNASISELENVAGLRTLRISKQSGTMAPNSRLFWHADPSAKTVRNDRIRFRRCYDAISIYNVYTSRLHVLKHNNTKCTRKRPETQKMVKRPRV